MAAFRRKDRQGTESIRPLRAALKDSFVWLGIAFTTALVATLVRASLTELPFRLSIFQIAAGVIAGYWGGRLGRKSLAPLYLPD